MILLLLFLFAMALIDNVIIMVDAIKPIKNIHVTFRDETFVIPYGCSTTEELADRFRQVSGKKDLKDFHILCKKKVLDPKESLVEAGIKPGDKVMILPPSKEAKGQDLLAMYLFMASNGIDTFSKIKSSLTDDQVEQLEQLEEIWKETKHRVHNLNRKDVADGLRTAFDVTYHRLRSFWEHPLIRQELHNPDRIESYRKVVTTNVSPQLLKQWKLDEVVKSKDKWRQEFLKLSSNIIRLGDTVLDGVLDVLLDVLKGKGASVKYASNGPDSAWDERNQQSSTSTWNPNLRIEDPDLANNLLFELSESDEDEDEL
ncbi:hypothetical protein IV203_007897 [Nitzschia inconspicua]|uniref:Ubiquitin-like domain-containing protein n=1 Tax=Nitzschia inconspicua TaxID=303405 RepID=A0A9K3KYN8_9STRA|nr:hypothetical protein IV203_007897 [Nitzschia inconspicua]